MRVKADGSGQARTGPERKGLRERPDVALLDPPAGPVARRPDARDGVRSARPVGSDVVLQFYDIVTKASKNPKVPETSPLGHQDPAWRPDGKRPPVRPQRPRRQPRGARRSTAGMSPRRRATAFTGPGYLEPAFSPDGRYVAATKTSASATTS